MELLFSYENKNYDLKKLTKALESVFFRFFRPYTVTDEA
jgi:hypothetical protein